MTSKRSALIDRLVQATIAVLLWGAAAIWICDQLGTGQLVKVAAVWAGIGAILSGAALLPRRGRP